MSQISLQSLPPGVRAPCVRVVFSFHSDRWSHEIQLSHAKGVVSIASSVEGDSDDDWPPSPALQEISKEDIGNRVVVLGVGMAGSNHWSISVSVVENQRVKLDNACLVKNEQIGWLGSTYQISEGVRVEAVSETEVRLEKDGFLIPLAAVSEAEWGTSLSVVGTRITARPSHISKSPVKSTRWGLCVGNVGN